MVHSSGERMRWLSKYGTVVVECKYSDMMATRKWRVFWEKKWGDYSAIRFYSLDSDLHTALGMMVKRVLDHQKEDKQ
jgi:hypothetical protein